LGKPFSLFMHTQVDKSQENKSESRDAGTSEKGTAAGPSIQFADGRPEAALQRNVQEMADTSSRTSQLKAMQQLAESKTTALPIQKKENRTGLSDQLKTGIENLSGHSMDDVSVHYNSAKPAQLHAHAYAQGTDIHVAPGQEKHIPHEAWHVVQQKQGRVKPTVQLKGKMNINDDAGLEKEADVMGSKALRMKSADSRHDASPGLSTVSRSPGEPMQMKWIDVPKAEYYQWRPLINGLLWLSHKTEDLTYYMIIDKTAFEGAHGKANAIEWAREQGVAKPYAEWSHLEKGVYEGEDVIEAMPDEAPKEYDDDQITAGYPALKQYPDFEAIKTLPSSLLKRIFDNCRTNNIPDLKAEKSFNIENLVTGIRIGMQQQPKYFHFVLGALANDAAIFKVVFDAIVYTTYKNRWDYRYFKPIVEGMVFNETLKTPRGFTEEQFIEFKKDYLGLLGPHGWGDIRIQGSTNLDIPGPVKDVDIAIMATRKQYDQKMLQIHGDTIVRTLQAGGKSKELKSLVESDIQDALLILKDSRIKQNSAQKSFAYIYPKGFIKHSDYLSKSEKKVRDTLDAKWMQALNLQSTMDMSIILFGSPFDKAPYLKL